MAERDPDMGGGKIDSCPRRCPHCAGPLSKEMETEKWTISPFLRDSFSTLGTGVGYIAGSFYGYNRTIPIVRRYIKGSMWLHFLIAAPVVVVFSSGCAGLAGGSLPALAQLASSSYHARASSPTSPPSSEENL